MTPDEAIKLLQQFTNLDRRPADVMPDRATTKAALAIVCDHSDYQILGICADDQASGTAALQSYITALGYKFIPTVNPIEGPIYIKYNPKLRNCHSDRYGGGDRGVLVACQAEDPNDVRDTFGHLPLDLFSTATV
jgi:hypothetical protein